MDLSEQMAKDGGEQVVPQTEELDQLSQMASRQLELERQLIDANTIVKTITEELRNVQETGIPNLMASIGITDFRLTNGFRVTIKEDVYASVRKDFQDQAFAWLDSKGIGDVVKQDVVVKFGRGMGDEAALAVTFAREHGWNVADKKSVHSMTLKALVKEQMANGIEFPDEYFSIAPVRKSIIKQK